MVSSAAQKSLVTVGKWTKKAKFSDGIKILLKIYLSIKLNVSEVILDVIPFTVS